MNITFDIIIPIWNQSELTIKCLKSIRQHTHNYRLILINNGSEPEEWDLIKKEADNHRSVKIITNSENTGFVKAVNQGIAEVTAPFVVFMNNDTEAVRQWTQKLVNPLVKTPKIMLSGPLTTTPESWQGKYPKGRPGYVIRTRGMLAFFCTMFRSEVFKKVGLLDESFGVGFGDDDDYCHRVLDSGYVMALVQNLVIPHHHRSTFRKIYDETTIKEMQTAALLKYKKKHGLPEI